MRKRAGALIIKDSKLLLISEGGQQFFWTPGGGLEIGESYITALRRELLEELNVILIEARFFISIEDKINNENVRYYLVKLKSYPKLLSKQTKFHWYTKSDLTSNEIAISPRVLSTVYPKLVELGYV